MLFQRCPRGGLVLLGSSVSTRVRALLSFLVRLGLVSMNGLTFASFSVVVGWSKCPCRTSIRAGYLGTGVSLAHLPRKLKLMYLIAWVDAAPSLTKVHRSFAAEVYLRTAYLS
ncbi:hypothetical protein EDD16DRAFT_486009 [Pisolithus croceorrhizus]|nr:hypothetical protein EDD16DRAFT_486009 [Pisolithus croceorrhizus]KAI6168158.1 hypothetical protein EDD17DRAFT_1532325 [Pisolithus thermaeus]